jgi:hypothetical protein
LSTRVTLRELVALPPFEDVAAVALALDATGSAVRGGSSSANGFREQPAVEATSASAVSRSAKVKVSVLGNMAWSVLQVVV